LNKQVIKGQAAGAEQANSLPTTVGALHAFNEPSFQLEKCGLVDNAFV